MSVYRDMDMFNRHNEIKRVVEKIPGGVRTITRSDSPDLADQLHTHVSSMYAHLNDGAEMSCMSRPLPTLFVKRQQLPPPTHHHTHGRHSRGNLRRCSRAHADT